MTTTEEKIIDASILEFSEYGYEGARIDRIAVKAQVNKAMIYYHYKSKENLYESIIMKNLDKLSELIRKNFPEEKADISRIYSFISILMEFIQSIDPAILKLIMHEITSGGNYIRKIIFPKLIQPISTMIGQGLLDEIKNKHIRPINPYYTMLIVIGGIIYLNLAKIILQGTPLHKLMFTKNYSEDFKNNLIDILKHGIEIS